VILGFGSNERNTAKEILNECYQSILKNPTQPEKAVEEIENKYKDLDKKYHNMDKKDAPERYSVFYPNLYKLAPFDTKFIIKCTFLHTNRRHPFSPDGWAAIESKWILFVDLDENKKEIYEQQG